MLIALDYDRTYTLDPVFWNRFINGCKVFGHTVVVATMRYAGTWEEEDVLAALEDKVDRVVFTSRKAKKPFLEELGIFPDVWVDDNPRWIYEDGGEYK